MAFNMLREKIKFSRDSFLTLQSSEEFSELKLIHRAARANLLLIDLE